MNRANSDVSSDNVVIQKQQQNQKNQHCYKNNDKLN